MTIVCATHVSGASSSSAAIRVAAELARRRRERLFLVNVQPKGSGEQTETAALATLGREAAALGNGLEIGTAVLHGALSRTVWSYCVERGARLLVVGDTNHTNALFENPLDQFAYGVDVPLLVVRDERPLLAWARGVGRLKVLLALDRTQTSVLARDWIIRLAEYGPVDLIASHIWWPPEEYDRHNLPTSTEPDDHEALELLIRREVDIALARLPDNVAYRLHLEIGHQHVGDRLLALAVAEQVDLFVLGTHPAHGPLSRLWSVSRDVLALAPMSVVCVPGATFTELRDAPRQAGWPNVSGPP